MALAVVAMAAVAGCESASEEELLAGKACGPGGECAAGYECDSGSHICVPAGSASGGAGAVGGAGGTAGAGGAFGGGGSGTAGAGGSGGGPATCKSLLDCPTPENACEAPVCIGGLCGSTPVQAGTPLPDAQQIAGDCQLAICDGYGKQSGQNDDADLPDDGQSCTADVCNSGVPSHEPLAIGSSCAELPGGVCSDSGVCQQCNVPSDCVGLPPNSECQQRDCQAGQCGQIFAAQGTAVALQHDGDCHQEQCDGNGAVISVVDDTDLPVDGLECTDDVCSGGTASNPNKFDGTTCGSSGQCLGGVCVGCVTNSDCGADTFCQAHICSSNSCSVVNTADGTPLPVQNQLPGDCQEQQCDGTGASKSVADDLDLPTDDGNECTDEVCLNGSPQHPNKPLDAVCTVGGIVCDGNGSCVACNSAGQCAGGTPCQTASCTSHACGLSNTTAGTPAPPSEQTAGDCQVVQCDGGGGTSSADDPGDLPFDANECTDDVCSGSPLSPSNPPTAPGTPCQNNSGQCDGAGSCSLLGLPGDPCSSGGQCQSGFCADGVCCGGVCTGTCEACLGIYTGLADGSCGPILSGQDPDVECPPGQTCNGAGSCGICSDHDWAAQYGGNNDQRGLDVATDSSGNIVLVGWFKQTIDFGGGVLNAAGNKSDAFVAKLDASGGHQWSQRYGDAPQPQEATAVAVDGNGNVIVAGSFQGTIDLGGGPLVTAGGWDVFVAKLDASGVYQWGQSYGDGGDQRAEAVAVDPSGNVVLAGQMEGTVDFGGGPRVSGGGFDAFVVKIHSSGVHQWSARYGDSSDQVAYGVATDSGGNVLLTGELQGSVDFGSGPLVSSGGRDIFVVKLSPTGTLGWAQRFGDTDDQTGLDVAADSSSSVIVTGQLRGTTDFGTGPLTSPGGKQDVFAVKFFTGGVPMWAKNFGNVDDQTGRAVAIGSDDHVWLTGEVIGSIDFGGGLLSAAGTKRDVFLARLDPLGKHVCSKIFGDSNDDFGRAIALGPLGGAVLAGDFRQSIDFGGGAMASVGNHDVFVAKRLP